MQTNILCKPFVGITLIQEDVNFKLEINNSVKYFDKITIPNTTLGRSSVFHCLVLYNSIQQSVWIFNKTSKECIKIKRCGIIHL